MSKTSELSTAKSIREKFNILVHDAATAEPGWKTSNAWSVELGMKIETFRKRVESLIQVGKAKKKQMLTKHHGVKTHYWIDNLSKPQ